MGLTMEKLFEMSKKEISRYHALKNLHTQHMSQKDTAELLGVSERHVRRLLKRYQTQGAEGLVSGHRGKRSNNSLSDALKNKAINLVRTKYWGFGPTLAREKLVENHKIKVSVETLRKWMIECDLHKRKRRSQPKLYQSRERRACLGELIQVDGSPHAWFEDRGDKCSLLAFIDDATSRIMHLQFVNSESTQTYFESFKKYLLLHGKAQAFYTDRHSVFRVNAKEHKGNGLTQLSRALKELDIELICANSPQAKGRVERLFKTLQDRLVKEMKLKRISTIEEGNKYLPNYIKTHNAQFSISAKDPKDAHRLLDPKEDLEKVFCYKATRKLTKNLELSFRGRVLQIQEEENCSYQLRKATVELLESLNGELTIYYQSRKLKYKELLIKDHQGQILNRKEVMAKSLTA